MNTKVFCVQKMAHPYLNGKGDPDLYKIKTKVDEIKGKNIKLKNTITIVIRNHLKLIMKNIIKQKYINKKKNFLILSEILNEPSSTIVACSCF